MARDIDVVIDYVRSMDNHYLPPVMKQVVINRLDPAPTREEIERAAKQVYGAQPMARHLQDRWLP